MRVEENVQSVPTDDPASVKNFNRLSIIVAGNYHFRTEGVFFISRHKNITLTYLMTACRFAVRISAAALPACTVSRYAHHYRLPLTGRPGSIRP